ncbi:hypothetical protein A5N15_00845 [Rothia kristinae]|uniref:Glycosyl transferase family 1 domain-containing protein n=1 Tax=Rothia kristinae TaxID=37923 RepID=A0A657IVZ0_9MICC|nr:hypothetical protein A5N15_00845 [Rothia kristinae]
MPRGSCGCSACLGWPRRKNLDVLLEAFARVREQVPEATLEVAGEGPLRSQLEDRARTLGVAEAVRFVGFADPIEAMGRADVLAQLSAWENLSYTLLDAAAVGLPVVATEVGGNAEILPAGSLVSSPDPAVIARKLMTAEADPGLRRAGGMPRRCARASPRPMTRSGPLGLGGEHDEHDDGPARRLRLRLVRAHP